MRESLLGCFWVDDLLLSGLCMCGRVDFLGGFMYMIVWMWAREFGNVSYVCLQV